MRKLKITTVNIEFVAGDPRFEGDVAAAFAAYHFQIASSVYGTLYSELSVGRQPLASSLSRMRDAIVTLHQLIAPHRD